jgi:hypothetical protein
MVLVNQMTLMIPPGDVIFLSLVVPCYNEQEVLPETAKKLSGKLQQLISE